VDSFGAFFSVDFGVSSDFDCESSDDFVAPVSSADFGDTDSEGASSSSSADSSVFYPAFSSDCSLFLIFSFSSTLTSAIA